jgi:hypothetical protein
VLLGRTDRQDDSIVVFKVFLNLHPVRVKDAHICLIFLAEPSTGMAIMNSGALTTGVQRDDSQALYVLNEDLRS